VRCGVAPKIHHVESKLTTIRHEGTQSQNQLPHHHPSLSPTSASASSASSIALQQQQLLLNRQMETQSQLQLEKSRVTLILQINTELLRETISLQASGRGAGGEEHKTPDKGYIEYATKNSTRLPFSIRAFADTRSSV